MGIGKCFVVEALLEFFQMADANQNPLQNAPNSLDEEQMDVYIITTIEKFLNEYDFSATDDTEDTNTRDGVFSIQLTLMTSSCCWPISRMLLNLAMGLFGSVTKAAPCALLQYS